jgi:hypothetical protein
MDCGVAEAVTVYEEAFAALPGEPRISPEALAVIVKHKQPHLTWRQVADSLLDDGMLHDIPPTPRHMRHICPYDLKWHDG